MSGVGIHHGKRIDSGPGAGTAAATAPPTHDGAAVALAAPTLAVPLDAPVQHFLRPGTLRLQGLPPLSLYVHLPWCLRKCPYCDFNSHERADGVDPAVQARYVDALLADLEGALPFVWGRPVHTVFLGGGTPSLFAPAAVDRLLGAVRARLPLVPAAEITLEANPGTWERGRFADYRAAGVTRLSVGVQSFDDGALARIGRVHDAAQAHAAVAEAAASFETWNLDLMYALPQQNAAALASDVAQALAHAPPHLSIYHLTVEPNTRFALAPPPLPDDDSASDMLDLLVARTAAVGLERYEVSAFARPGHRCRHNVNYWAFGDYLGIGAGAHAKLSFPQRVVRQVRWREPARYVEQALAGRAVSNQHEVPRRELPAEFMLGALRLKDGVDRALFAERTGLPASALEPAWTRALERGLVDGGPDDTRLAATARGFDFLSDLQAMFLPA